MTQPTKTPRRQGYTFEEYLKKFVPQIANRFEKNENAGREQIKKSSRYRLYAKIG